MVQSFTQHVSIFLRSAVSVLACVIDKASWRGVMLMLGVCLLFSLGSNIAYIVFDLYPDRVLTLQDIKAIVVYSIPFALQVPFSLCVAWIGQYYVARFLQGKGSFLAHGYALLVCFMPLVIAWACLSRVPLVGVIGLLVTAVLLLVFLSGVTVNFYMVHMMHSVRWRVALASMLLGYACVPLCLLLLVWIFLILNISTFPHPS